MPKLDKNIVFFARLLRASGISIGSDSIMEAIESIKLVDIKNKKSFFYALQTCFIKRPEDMKIFEQAFSLFWQNPRFRDRMRDLLLPQTRIQNHEEEKEELAKRIQDTLSTPERPKERVDEEETLLIDTSGTASDTQLFNEKDFEMMSKEEIQIASQSIKELLIKIPKRPFRRSENSYLGQEVSARESLRGAKRNFGSVIPKLVRRKEVSRPVVVLLDISGSMENYSRMMIHFIHNLMQKHKKVHAFLFGTKLTNISFQMKNKDIDVALKEVSSSNSIIFLITDGLDLDHSTDLFDQMERLQKSCYKLVWLNPLLRFTDFLPKSISIKRILLNVDAFLPIHSIESMQNLTSLISKNLVKEHNDIITWHNKIEPQNKELV